MLIRYTKYVITPNLNHLARTVQMRGGGGGGGGGVGWCECAVKLPVLGRPTNLDYSRARAYCPYHRCGWGLIGHCFSDLSLLFSFCLSLWEMARYRLKYCLKGPLSLKQPTNQSDEGSKHMVLMKNKKNYPSVILQYLLSSTALWSNFIIYKLAEDNLLVYTF